jgi:catechol 2,3-dioxygenase-like lactoylglutathione lyase family enzyme
MRAIGIAWRCSARIRLAAVALAAALCLPVGASGEAPISAVGPIGITVADMERSIAFYGGVLGFEKVSDAEVWGDGYERLQGVFGLRMRVVRMQLGQEQIAVTEYLAPRGRPFPADTRANDRWFQHIAIIVSDMDRAYARLRRQRVQHASPAPQRLPDWNQAVAGIRAFYFRDPDGHFLEILWFPPDKGDPRWHRAADRLFVGIDHTAIVVSDTERSLACYRDTLGMRVAGESLNHGPEQERLNAVSGVRLRITTLRTGAGPGIELLEYVTPRDGRPVPPDAHANDLAHWQTALVAEDAAGVYRLLRRGPCVALSPSVVLLGDRALGFSRAALAADPDGHAFQVIEP